MQLGFGNTRYDYAYNGKGYTTDRHFILVYETNMTGHYKLIPGLGVGAGVGYQLMLVDNPGIRENFNTPIYVLKIKVFFGDIYRLVFPKKPEKKKK